MTWLDDANKEMKTLEKDNPNWVLMAVAGSQNYGTQIPTSDLDLKIVYCPEFSEFWHGAFASLCKVAEDVDYSVTPIHHYMKYVFKGNMNFWEVWYSQSLHLRPTFWGNDSEQIVSAIKTAVEMNYTPNFNANRGMALQKFKKYVKADDANVARKELQHACRILSTLKYYFESGNLCLDLPKEFRGNWSSLRQSEDESLVHLCANEYSKLIYWADEHEEVFIQRHACSANKREKLVTDITDDIMLRAQKMIGCCYEAERILSNIPRTRKK